MQDYETIFAAHFPGMPILPGACIVQMAVEEAEQLASCSLCISEASNVKFLVPVTPDAMKHITCHVTVTDEDSDSMAFRAVVKDDATTYAKMMLRCNKKK